MKHAKHITVRLLSAVAVALTGLAVVSTSASAAPSYYNTDEDTTYVVTFRNLTEGQYLTPPAFATHSRYDRVFSIGQEASPGLQGLAENGDVPTFAAELEAFAANVGGVSGVGADGPVAPGEEVTFEFTTNARRLSIASMIVCTNDGFAGLNTAWLPSIDGYTLRYNLRAYDAGTEINTELRQDLVPAPFCGEGEGTGESNPALAENGVIGQHKTLQNTGDLDPALDWSGPPAEITIKRKPEPTTYRVTVHNITDAQYLTPPNYAAHDRSVAIFSRREAASPGLQAVAENGGVPVLAEELQAKVDDAGLGVSGVGADAPIAPGESATFEFTTDQAHISMASMIICTNDGFAGLDTVRLPSRTGRSYYYRGHAYDAGTEINTELRQDLVPAPFCGEGEGTGESNPALAENGVVTRHKTLQNTGDLDPALDWRGPVAIIEIERLD